MRYSASEKIEIIRLVEQSHLPARRTLERLGVSRPTFYRWYDLYRRFGEAGLEDHRAGPRRVWNRIPEAVRGEVLELALDRPELSPRELAVAFTDERALVHLGSLGLSAAEGAWVDDQPRLHRYEGGRRGPGKDHSAKTALADRLPLSQD